MKDYYPSVEDAFDILIDIARDFDPDNVPDQPPGFRGMLLMVNPLGTSVCAWTIIGGQYTHLGIIYPGNGICDNPKYFRDGELIQKPHADPRALPKQFIKDLSSGSGMPGGKLGGGLEGLGIKWAMLRNGLDIEDHG